MARCALDNLPQWTWFVGLDLRTAAIIIATLGIVHPMAYVYTCFLYRSYLFLTIWLITGVWTAFSIWLFVGIMQSMEVAYEAWVWFTFVFVFVMVALMVVLLALFCCARRVPACAVLVPVLGILYYGLTFYSIFVVNSQRMAAFSAPP